LEEIFPPGFVRFTASAHVVDDNIGFTIYGNYILIGYLDARPKAGPKNQNTAQTAGNAEKCEVSEGSIFPIYLPCIDSGSRTVFWDLKLYS